jgi:predicted CXXCH cytochrome family protein
VVLMSTDSTIRRLTVLVLAVFAAGAQADPNWRENGNSEAAQMARSGGQCVRETGWMRRHHMALLKHDRDLTVVQGVREIDGSLAECVSCHVNTGTQGGFVPVNTGDEFCAGCHQFAGVMLDCFQCHATVPTE